MKKPAKEKSYSLVYHIQHGRQKQGCLPLFVLIAALLVGTALIFVKVEKPQPAPNLGEADVYYLNDTFSYVHLRQDIALPFPQPKKLNPPVLPYSRRASLAPLPPLSPFDAPRGSVILDEENLLELPPAPSQTQP